ncbi:MAG TPA: permease-like cell division protein FtsX [bacterium]|nr:permease-like cell division protein FtsX [bacterium]HNF86816.1 permease-like cell division protein FtsX [bacterium]HNO91346.1 permease-like cell division protein FtsX [bacterium]
MHLGYLFKESFSGLRRATLSTFVAVTIIAIALSLFSFFLIITLNINQLVEDIRSRVELEAFLDRALDTPQSKKIEAAIRDIEGVESVTFISKSDAARILKKAMGADDIFDLVESNPLPASFKIRLQSEYRNWQNVLAVAQSLETIDGVEEVSYQKELLLALDEKVDLYNMISIGLGCIAALAAVLLVSNTIKLSIYAKRDVIKTMKLVGAKNSFIAAPFILEGILQGVLGSLIATGIAYALIRIVQRYLLPTLQFSWEIPAIVVGFGILLGLFGSFVSIRFFLKEKISDM